MILVSDYVTRLDLALSAEAIPHYGCAQLTPGVPLEPAWHVVQRPDFPVRIDYRPEATAAQIARGDQLALDEPAGQYRPRLVWDVYHEVDALSAANKTAIWNDLNAGTPPKWALDRGYNSADLNLIWLLATQLAVVSSAADKNLCRSMLIAIFVVDNPSYLVNPPFAAGVNIPGDEPVP